MPSPRLTTAAGISAAAILQEMQLLTVPQRSPNRIPKLAALLLRRGLFDLAQLLEQLTLLRRQLVRGPDVDPHVHVAVATFAQTRQALVADPVRHAGLGTGLETQRRLPVRRRHRDVCAQRGLRERDAEIVDQIVAVTLEARIVLDVEHGDEIAARAIPGAGHALAAQ